MRGFTFVLTFLPWLAMAAEMAPAPTVKPYPLKTCIISGDDLGSMGEAVTVVRDGQEFKLCCKGCLKKLDRDLPGALAKLNGGAVPPPAQKPVDTPATAEGKPGCCH